MKLTPKHKINLLSLVVFAVMLLLNSCGGGSSSSGGGQSGVAGINGRIVFSDRGGEPSAANIFSLDFVNGNAQNLDALGKGYGSNIGADGSVIYVQTCASSTLEQLVIVDTSGIVTPISSCPSRTSYDFISPKFSPNQKKIAVSLLATNQFVSTTYPIVAVFERNKVDMIDIEKLPIPGGKINPATQKESSIKLFRGYNAFAWKPDGSLLLIGSGQRLILKEGPYGEVLEELPTIKLGIYVTDKNLNNPVRIENKINSPVFRPDVNKKGSKVTYSSNNNIFIMDLATGAPQKIRANTVAGIAHAPVWSPDGRYIAYGQKERYGYREEVIYFYELSSKKIIPIGVPHRTQVEGPLSWIRIP